MIFNFYLTQDKWIGGIIYVKKINSRESNVIIWFILLHTLNPLLNFFYLPLLSHTTSQPQTNHIWVLCVCMLWQLFHVWVINYRIEIKFLVFSKWLFSYYQSTHFCIWTRWTLFQSIVHILYLLIWPIINLYVLLINKCLLYKLFLKEISAFISLFAILQWVHTLFLESKVKLYCKNHLKFIHMLLFKYQMLLRWQIFLLHAFLLYRNKSSFEKKA